MYDLHCHLLPGIDDGPETLEQALALAQLACTNGISHAVVTPHIHPGRYENTRQSIQAVYQNFKQELANHEIPLSLGFAAEVRLGAEILAWALDDKLPFLGTLNGDNILLLECPHSHIPPGADKLVEWLLKRNIRPMIAHPERNKDIMRDYSKLRPFVELGCLLQITADSAAGFFGAQAEYRAHQIISEGHATVLASDGHNIKHRPPRLQQGVDAAALLIGSDKARSLIWDMPEAISRGQF